MPTATQTHRTKRQYQPNIDSFFTRVDREEYLSSTSIAPSELDDHTSLPAVVQSNLLSVGMRVRKAVPEGYQTGKGSVDFSPVDDFAVLNSTVISAHVSELQPYCGLHRTGGFGVQQSIPVDMHMVLDNDNDTIVSLSQTSIGSSFSNISINSSTTRVIPPSITVTPTRPKHKRRLDSAYDDSDDDEFDQFGRMRSPSVSPRTSFPNARLDLDLLTSNSVTSIMARPVAKMKRRVNTGAPSGTVNGRRGAVDMSATAPDGDFDEADFLCDGEDWESGQEIEMGGV